MTREEAIEEIKSWTPVLMSMGSKCTEKTAEAQRMAIEALEERLDTDHKTIQADFGEVERHGIKNADFPERFTATNCSCLDCKNRHSVHCEYHNKKIYGYCGNWERR